MLLSRLVQYSGTLFLYNQWKTILPPRATLSLTPTPWNKIHPGVPRHSQYSLEKGKHKIRNDYHLTFWPLRWMTSLCLKLYGGFQIVYISSLNMMAGICLGITEEFISYRSSPTPYTQGWYPYLQNTHSTYESLPSSLGCLSFVMAKHTHLLYVLLC